MPGSALKVCVGGGGWVVLKVNLVIDFGYSLALAKPNKNGGESCRNAHRSWHDESRI